MLKTVPQLKTAMGGRLYGVFFLPSCFKRTKIAKEVHYLNQKKAPVPRRERRGISLCRGLYMAYLCICLSVFLVQPASAATIWEKASEIMQDVYTQILTISTIAAIVTASVALLMMNFSRSGRTVDESRAWLKRIVITWAVLNGLGFIMSYITPFFSGGQWTP